MHQMDIRKPDQITTLENEGFLGSFYRGDCYVDKAIIMVGGIGERRHTVEARAAILAREGYSVLAVGYYLWAPLPRQTVAIPLDYIEKAIDWLETKCPIPITRIGMIGLSLGAAYTALCGSHFPQIHCAVVVSGFDFVVEGCKHMVIRQHRSYFSLHGQDIPYEPAEALSHLPATLIRWWKDPRYSSKAMNRFYYNECFPNRTDASRIKVENGNCDWLLIAPGYDDTWPSDASVKRMMHILEESRYPHRYECAIYERGSHLLGITNEALAAMGGGDLEKMQKLLGHLFTMEKKYPEKCMAAREESYQKILSFLRVSMTEATSS